MSEETFDPVRWVTAAPWQHSQEGLLTGRQGMQESDWWEELGSRQRISRQTDWSLVTITSINGRSSRTVPGRRCDWSLPAGTAIASLSAGGWRTRAAAGSTQLSSAAWRAALPEKQLLGE
jgi:hypothetical protein